MNCRRCDLAMMVILLMRNFFLIKEIKRSICIRRCCRHRQFANEIRMWNPPFPWLWRRAKVHPLTSLASFRVSNIRQDRVNKFLINPACL